MNYQGGVKETYLRVIESTIEGAKADFQENGELTETLSATLDSLRDRWQTRLLEVHDFTDDPTASVRGSSSRGGGTAGRRGAASDASGAQRRSGGAGGAKPTTAERARAMGAPAAADAGPLIALGAAHTQSTGVQRRRAAQGGLGNASTVPPQAAMMRGEFPNSLSGIQGVRSAQLGSGLVARPPGGSMAPVAGMMPINPLAPQPLEHYAAAQPALDPAAYAGSALTPSIGESTQGSVPGQGSSNVPQGDGPGSSEGSPPAKRARREGAEEDVNDNENLDSSDDDDEDGSDAGSDAAAENYIVAQHDSVKKGSGNGKWKVRLKGGIVHVNGRDYLFNKATCDLDW